MGLLDRQLTRGGLALCQSAFQSSFKLFSVLSRPPPRYDGHVPLTALEKAALGIGSAVGAFFNPHRADLVAALGEVTAGPFIRERYNMSPDVRDQVRHIDDEECAYVMQRYRECHDLYHAVLGLPPSFVEGEIALKAFEFVNTGLPMTALSLFAVARLKDRERDRFFGTFLPWAVRSARRSKPIINVYWEEELLTDVNALLETLDLEKPPDLHNLRRKSRK